jgi:hypothetical protein
MQSSAKEARKTGDRHYFTGKPCLRGHLSQRWTSTQQCVECSKAFRRAFLATDVGQQLTREAQKRHYITNKQKRHENVARWRANNPDQQKAILKRYRDSANGHAMKLWHQHIAEGANPKARTVYGQEGVIEIYAEARRLGLTVDHIDPLKHDLICGLHNRFNLQMLSKQENARKGNSWTSREEMFKVF